MFTSCEPLGDGLNSHRNGGTLLVVEDDPATRELLALMLRHAGYAVQAEGTLAGGFDALAARGPTLLLLDLGLPDGDGTLLLRRAVAQAVPVMVVTSRDSPADAALGLELGADDFVRKPFDPGELLARVKAVLRRQDRSGSVHGEAVAQSPQRIHLATGVLNLDARTFQSRNGSETALTRGEFALLQALIEAKGRTLSRDRLLDCIGSSGSSGVDRTVDVLISRLRRKIEADPAAPSLLRTVPGLGYRFQGEWSYAGD